MKIIAILIAFLFSAAVQVQSEDYQCTDDPDKEGFHSVSRKCDENEDLTFEFDNITTMSSVIISRCASVTLEPPYNVAADLTLENIKIENIKNTTVFKPTLGSSNLGKIELLNIGYIPEMKTEYMFHSVRSMDRFVIEKTTIGRFDQVFAEAKLNIVEWKDVCIENLVELSGLSETQGNKLEIINCYIFVTKSPVDPIILNFGQIKISDSTFEFNDTGTISIIGNRTELSNNNIINAIVNIKGNEIEVNNTCGDGVPSMNIESSDIKCHGNKISGKINVPANIAKKCDNVRDHRKCGINRSICRTIEQGEVPSPRHTNNAAKIIHLDNGHVFFLSLTIIASFIVTWV